MNKNIIELQDVWRIYHLGEVEVPALRGLTMEVKRGEFLAVQGASGSGKSTALNMIGSLDLPTKGKVLLDGQDISKLSESGLAKIRGKKIGYIFQTFNLISSLNAMENVMLPMAFQGYPQDERKKRALHFLDIVGLGDRVNHKPSELSGGQRQRVAVARALANDPEVILADEPTGNLDSKTGEEIIDLLKNLHKNQKKTIIMVTHDDKLARRAERIIKLKDGKVSK